MSDELQAATTRTERLLTTVLDRMDAAGELSRGAKEHLLQKHRDAEPAEAFGALIEDLEADGGARLRPPDYRKPAKEGPVLRMLKLLPVRPAAVEDLAADLQFHFGAMPAPMMARRLAEVLERPEHRERLESSFRPPESVGARMVRQAVRLCGGTPAEADELASRMGDACNVLDQITVNQRVARRLDYAFNPAVDPDFGHQAARRYREQGAMTDEQRAREEVQAHPRYAGM